VIKVTNASLYDCVKNVNDTYRTALMNRKYYGYRLSLVKRWNTVMEIVIATGTSSAIGAWAIWKSTSVGANVWAILAGLAALFAVVKPFLNLSKRVEIYSELFVGHGDVYYDLKTITMELARVRDYTDKIHEAFERALERIKQLALKDDPKIDDKLRRKSFEEVKREIQVESLWWPT
jgi:hypothetical protein